MIDNQLRSAYVATSEACTPPHILAQIEKREAALQDSNGLGWGSLHGGAWAQAFEVSSGCGDPAGLKMPWVAGMDGDGRVYTSGPATNSRLVGSVLWEIYRAPTQENIMAWLDDRGYWRLKHLENGPHLDFEAAVKLLHPEAMVKQTGRRFQVMVDGQVIAWRQNGEGHTVEAGAWAQAFLALYGKERQGDPMGRADYKIKVQAKHPDA